MNGDGAKGGERDGKKEILWAGERKRKGGKRGIYSPDELSDSRKLCTCSVRYTKSRRVL